MGGEDRGAAMAASVGRTARSLGISPDGVSLLSRAHALAMEPRVAALDDDHHPLYLHPGRSVLVLIRDAGVRDPTLLAAAALVESEDRVLRVDLALVGEHVAEHVADVVRGVPPSDAPSLAEMLVTASAPVRMVALAERLDHLRHAHLREADAAWHRRIFDEASAVYLPVAERTHPRLAVRYRHWRRTFARRMEREAHGTA